jgi:hypothetical protein
MTTYNHHVKIYEDNQLLEIILEKILITDSPFPLDWIKYKTKVYVYDITDYDGTEYYIESLGADLDAIEE